MKIFKVLSPFILIGILLVTSCKHEPDPTPTAPIINVMAPGGGTYNNGDTVFMQATLSDEDALHEAFICISDTTDTMFSFAPSVHTLQTYELDTFWVVTGISATTSSFVTYKAENHQALETIIYTGITLAP